jgi:hypothetical protein
MRCSIIGARDPTLEFPSDLPQTRAPREAVAPASAEDACPSSAPGSVAALAGDLMASCQCRKTMLADSEDAPQTAPAWAESRRMRRARPSTPSATLLAILGSTTGCSTRQLMSSIWRCRWATQCHILCRTGQLRNSTYVRKSRATIGPHPRKNPCAVAPYDTSTVLIL